MKYLVCLLIVLIGLTGCMKQSDPLEPGQKRDPVTGRAFSDDKIVTLDNGCEIHSVSVRGGPYLNMAYCPMGPTGTSWSCGKSTCYAATAPLVKQPSPQELAKAAALAKLTAEDKKALDLKD